MAKRKKRNAITMVSLLLALAALIGVYYWYTHRPVDEDKDEATESIDLATIDTDQIKSMHYVVEDADLILVKKDDVWISQEEPERPINQDNVKSILYAIDDINADRIINENPEDLAEYGLADPAAFLEVTQNDGTVVTLKVGSVAGKSLGYYGLVNDDGIVYLLPIEIGTALQYNDSEMTDIEKAPSIVASTITSITVLNRDGENYELRYDDTDEPDNTGSTMYTWKLLQPYGEGYSADYSKIQDILNNYTTYNYSKNVDYSGENYDKYGLDDPAHTIEIGFTSTSTEILPTPEVDPETGETITEKKETKAETYKIYIGNKDEDGTNYYVRVDGNKCVYLLRATTVDKMLDIDAFSLMNSFVCIPNIDTVDWVVINVEGTEYKLEMKHTTEKGDDGKEKDVVTYYYNGKEADEDDFKALYQKVVSATYDTEAKEEVNIDGVTPYLTMSFHIFGDHEKTVSASFLPYDDNFYVVEKDGLARFLVDKRKVEDIAKALSSFTGTK